MSKVRTRFAPSPTGYLHIMEAIGEIKSIERESDRRVQEWQSNIALLTVNGHINLIKSKHKRHKKINKFLDTLDEEGGN